MLENFVPRAGVPLLDEEDAFDRMKGDQSRGEPAQLRIPDAKPETLSLLSPVVVAVGADHLSVVEPDHNLRKAVGGSWVALISHLEVAGVHEDVLDRRERDPREFVVTGVWHDRKADLAQGHRLGCAVHPFSVHEVHSDSHVQPVFPPTFVSANTAAGRITVRRPI